MMYSIFIFLLIGGAIGAAASPKSQDDGANAALGASIAGALSGAYIIATKDKSEELSRIAKENQELKKLIDGEKQEILINEGRGLLGSNLPSKVRGVVSPGAWKLYKIDRWVKDEANPNIFYHQNEMLEIEPPSIGE